MNEQLNFICLPRLERALILKAIKERIVFIGKEHRKRNGGLRQIIAKNAECYARVMGEPIHDNRKLLAAKYLTPAGHYAGGFKPGNRT